MRRPGYVHRERGTTADWLHEPVSKLLPGSRGSFVHEMIYLICKEIFCLPGCLESAGFDFEMDLFHLDHVTRFFDPHPVPLREMTLGAASASVQDCSEVEELARESRRLAGDGAERGRE